MQKHQIHPKLRQQSRLVIKHGLTKLLTVFCSFLEMSNSAGAEAKKIKLVFRAFTNYTWEAPQVDPASTFEQYRKQVEKLATAAYDGFNPASHPLQLKLCKIGQSAVLIEWNKRVQDYPGISTCDYIGVVLKL